MTRRTRLLAALGLLTASTWMLQQAVDSAKETRRTKAAKARLDRDPPTRITAADEAHAGHHVHADDHPAIEAPHRPGAAPGISSPAILPPEALLAELADLPDTATYAPRQLLVEAESAEQLVMLAEANGYGVVLGRGGSPMGVLVLPEGADVDVALQVLGNTPGVLAADRNGVVRGAWYGSRDSSREAEETVSYSHLQWHLDDAGFSIPPEWRSTIAVLDSGMAYRTVSRCWCTDYQSFTEAPSLKEVDVDDPWDFVSSDRYPDDEHGHGTHITSLIASEGAVQGAAAGVDIMPYRVLDENNVGLESHLVDALWWATVMRADVVNMSLSFGPDYQPSASLHNQLEATAERGVVMVAAAGNTGGVGASWPAASPHVIGVGSSCMAGDGHSLADYSNMGSDVSVLAPGGCLDNDDNEDGHPDGLLAETFAIGQPDRIGLYWAQGTSQAAALVSSAAARLLYRGVDADSVEEVLQSSGWTVKTDDGLDFASLDYAGAGAYVSSPITPSQGYRVAMLPWVAEESGELVPRVELVVLDESLQPVDGVTVRGHFKGSTSSSFSCTTVDGACDASGKGAVDALAKEAGVDPADGFRVGRSRPRASVVQEKWSLPTARLRARGGYRIRLTRSLASAYSQRARGATSAGPSTCVFLHAGTCDSGHFVGAARVDDFRGRGEDEPSCRGNSTRTLHHFHFGSSCGRSRPPARPSPPPLEPPPSHGVRLRRP